MKKQLSILQTFLVTCLLLVIGGGSSLAQKTYSIDFESDSSDYSDWTFTNMSSKETGTISAHGGSCYGTTGGKTTASIVTKDKIDYPASITFYVSKQSTNTTSSNWKIQVSSDNKTWTDVKTQSATSMSKGSWVEVTQALSSYSDVYVRIYYTGSTAVRNIDDVTLSTRIQKTVSSLTVSGTFTDLWQGDDFNKTGITVIATYTDKTEEDVTSKCSYAGCDMNTAGDQTVSISYGEMIVQKAATVQTIANTEETAYTVTEAKSRIDAGKGLKTPVFVKGIVSKIANAWTSKNGYLSFFVSEDGTTSSDQFELYKNYKAANNTKYASANECPDVGDEVVGCGTLTKYNSTYELNAGNYIVSLKRKTDFTIDNAAVKNGEIITPVVKTNITGVTYTITYVSDNSSVVVYSDGALKAVGVGSAQVTATISADGYRTASTTFEVTVTTNASLSSIAISGDPTKTEYLVGESFDTEGLIVTATYSDASTADITSVADLQIDPATFTQDGNIEVSVTAKYNEVSSESANYSVTVSKKKSSIFIANIAIEKGNTFKIAATTIPEDAPLTYTILSGESVISIEGNVITALAAGEATVRADYAGSSEYKESSKEFNVIVSAAVSIDLTKDETTKPTTEDEMTWVNDVVTIKSIRTNPNKTAVNNYYPGIGKSSTRFYAGNTLSFTPMNGNTIDFVVYEATTVGYANAMANSDWTNATAIASDKTVTITPDNGAEEFSAVIGETTGGNSFNIVYTEPVTLPGKSGDLYYGTYSNNNSNVKITVDSENIVEVSTVTVSGGQLRKTERTGGLVAKGEGVLICSTTPKVTVTNISTDVEKNADNNLVATPFAKTNGKRGYKYYRMTYNDIKAGSGLGFYWGAADGVAFDVAAKGKAILEVSEEESSGAKGFSFIWDDTNAIRDIEVAPVDSNAIYNMQGQRVNASAKGLLIKNGKKYISK